MFTVCAGVSIMHNDFGAAAQMQPPKLNFRKWVGRVPIIKNNCVKVRYASSKSAITNAANATLAIPLVVKKARFTLLRSVGFTSVCW